MKSVIQEESTGCAIASTAVLARTSYKEAKKIANALGIFSDDTALWSETAYIRKLLSQFDIKTAEKETPFTDWKSVPDHALLSIKWHLKKGKPYWHWVVFVRENGEEAVFDSSFRLKTNIRKDFGRMNPKWFIRVY
jgi:ABC-type bacteriocin/lantibiotic exporter with double-glycine peptidase domain